MNDDQKVNQNTNTPLAGSTDQAQTQNPSQIVQGQPQVQSVGFPNKEQEPLWPVIEKSEVELKIDKELVDIGVEAKSDTIHLTPEHTQAGLGHAGASIPVPTSPSGIVNMQQTPEELKKNIKRTKPTDSLRGLLLEIWKNIQRIGLKEQRV